MKKINFPKFISKLIPKFPINSGAFSTSKSVTFNGLNFQVEVGKDGYKCRPLESKWYNSLYFRLCIFASFEMIVYMTTGRTVYGGWYFSMGFITIALLVIIYMYMFKDSKNLRMNHGAEHKVIRAFMNRDLKNAEKYSRFSDRCGGNIFSMMILLISLSPIVKLPITVFLICVVIYSNLKPARWIIFNTIGKTIQYLTTEEPTKEILENTKSGFEKLIYEETKKIIEDL